MAKPLSPIQRHIRKLSVAGEYGRLARILKIARVPKTKVSICIILAARFGKQGKRKAYKGMMRQARLAAADDYHLLNQIRLADSLFTDRGLN